MKAITKSIILFVLVICLAACSRKKNTFLSRNWHAMTAEYNTLYNGNLALELGKEELIANYRDNYWQLLPVERMQVSDEIILPGASKNPNFAVAEEKAVKAIQRHSMLIDGREHNPQIDEAYLLLGKARYYDQRFVPALSAFNYILHKYPVSNTINEARIWREKANMRMEFNQIALKNLKQILKQQETLKEDERAHASAILAQAYINLTEIDSAVAPIKQAAKLTDNNDKKGRYLYILGQLYNRLGKKDSANMAFNAIIDLKRRTPRVYRINAFIAQIKNKEPNPANRIAKLQLLEELQKNRENRPFLDKIYFQLAEFHFAQDSIALAMEYYNKSLQASVNNNYLQSLGYRTLGNINFDATNYQLAGAYYDSTLLKLPENSREFRRIKKKRDNLDEVIYFENIARKNDSILFLADLSQPERLEYFTQYTEKLKAETLKRIEAQKSAASAGQSNQPGPIFENPVTGGIPGVPNPANAFYFYNPTTVAYGRQQFFRIWGDRPLADNWRTQETDVLAPEIAGTEVQAETMVFKDNPIYDPQTYIAQIPTDPTILDSLESQRNYAYYQLGIIYKENFGEFQLAEEKLELLLNSNPQERLILPAKYNLYKIYLQTNQVAEAQSIKNDILHQYPDSRYAAILQNPKSLLNNKNGPQAMYNEVYELYKNQEYEQVIAKSNNLVQEFSAGDIVPKFELLKAMAIGRLKGLEAYKKALNYVALSFPQSAEGKKAQELFTNSLPVLAGKKFKKADISDSFNLVFPFEKSKAKEVAVFQKKMESVLKEPEYDYLDVSVDVFNPQLIFVVVHGFQSSAKARGFTELLSKNKKIQIDEESFYISNSNYGVLQIHKNLDAYLQFITKSLTHVSTK